MARLARAEVFAADEVALMHVVSRVVRGCFLLGDDPVTGRNYDHRKRWIEEDRLARIRSRLSDISWWMRLLCQRIAAIKNPWLSHVTSLETRLLQRSSPA